MGCYFFQYLMIAIDCYFLSRILARSVSNPQNLTQTYNGNTKTHAIFVLPHCDKIFLEKKLFRNFGCYNLKSQLRSTLEFKGSEYSRHLGFYFLYAFYYCGCLGVYLTLWNELCVEKNVKLNFSNFKINSRRNDSQGVCRVGRGWVCTWVKTQPTNAEQDKIRKIKFT